MSNRPLSTGGIVLLYRLSRSSGPHKCRFHLGFGLGQQINHLCQRPFCLQPGHLYACTGQDNVDDRRAHDGRYLRLDMMEGDRVPAGA